MMKPQFSTVRSVLFPIPSLSFPSVQTIQPSHSVFNQKSHPNKISHSFCRFFVRVLFPFTFMIHDPELVKVSNILDTVCFFFPFYPSSIPYFIRISLCFNPLTLVLTSFVRHVLSHQISKSSYRACRVTL